MGPLRVVYNVTSNISPYTDASSNSSGSRPGTSDDNGPTIILNHQSTAPPSQAFPSRPWRYVPRPLEKACKAVGTWAKGPVPPRPWYITPFFPKLQTAPIRLLDRYVPKQRHRVLLLIAFYFVWLLCFAAVLHQSAATAEVPGYGTPVPIDCTSTFWLFKNECGIDGDDCQPFTDTTLVFRCPGSCITTEVLEPHAVGAQEAIYRPLVIGGPSDPSRSVETAIYRGDSFICAAAIHAGFISNEEGGCGVVSLVGRHIDFLSVRQNKILSIGFNSSFPLSFKFLEGTLAPCKDLQWPLLAINVGFTVLLSLFTTSPTVFFVSIFTSLYWHTALVSDPPENTDYYTLVSLGLASFLPAAFVIWVMYIYCIRKTLGGLQAQIEKTLIWLGPCWVGALDNYTFEKIPIQRLTPHDLQQQPGAITALLIVILALLVIALGQAWAFRVAGLMPRYLAVYGILVVSLLLFLAVPNMHLRIHHYILALLLLPGTSLQTRPSLIYQGILVGLFINGVARWGFASILNTTAELQGDAQLGSALPKIDIPVIGASNITFNWAPVPSEYDGISILVNDVERYRKYGNSSTKYTWSSPLDGYPEYFRFGYMSGSTAEDYTMAGIWNADGTWTKMKSGPS